MAAKFSGELGLKYKSLAAALALGMLASCTKTEAPEFNPPVMPDRPVCEAPGTWSTPNNTLKFQQLADTLGTPLTDHVRAGMTAVVECNKPLTPEGINQEKVNVQNPPEGLSRVCVMISIESINGVTPESNTDITALCPARFVTAER